MTRFVRRAVSLATGLAMAASLVLPAFAETPTNLSATTIVQTSSKTATITQTGTAQSGAAVAIGEGAKAASGNATSDLTATQQQTTIQVAVVGSASADSGWVPQGSNKPTTTEQPGGTTVLQASSISQQATDFALIDQVGVAVSGSAAALGSSNGDNVTSAATVGSIPVFGGAVAKSGDADVEANAHQKQTTLQVAANVAAAVSPSLAFPSQTKSEDGFIPPTSAPTTESVALASQSQIANNAAFLLQVVGAFSGTAIAEGDFALAHSGDAYADADACQSQAIIQAVANVSLPFVGFSFLDDTTAVADAAQGALQFGSNWAQNGQTALAVSGPAAALGDVAFAFSGDADSYIDSGQKQLILQASLNAALLAGFDDREDVLRQLTFGGLDGSEVADTAIAVAESAQVAANTSLFSQSGTAASGAATALGDFTWAYSGWVESDLDAYSYQKAIQLFANAGLVFGGFGLGTDADPTTIATVIQTSQDLACIVQDALTESGAAVATDDFSKASSGYAWTDWFAKIKQWDIQAALVVNFDAVAHWFNGGIHIERLLTNE